MNDQLETLKTKLINRVDDVTSSRDPNEIMLAIVSTLELVISDIEELQAQETSAQPEAVTPDYSSMSMSELIDVWYVTHEPSACDTIYEAIADTLKYEPQMVTEEELKRGTDVFYQAKMFALSAMFDREIERRADALLCPECGKSKEICEQYGYWLPATLEQPAEFVCGKEPNFDAVQDEIPY